jgi:hypothetical protein
MTLTGPGGVERRLSYATDMPASTPGRDGMPTTVRENCRSVNGHDYCSHSSLACAPVPALVLTLAFAFAFAFHRRASVQSPRTRTRIASAVCRAT